MNHLLKSLLLLPLLVSCTMVEEEYYTPNYYGGPSIIEVHPNYEQGRYHEHQSERHQYHGHYDAQDEVTVHQHNEHVHVE